MNDIVKFTAMRGNGSEFLAKDNAGNAEWMNIDAIYKLVLANKVPTSVVTCTSECMQISIFGNLYKANAEEYSEAVKRNPVAKPAKKTMLKNPKVLEAIRAEHTKEEEKKKKLEAAAKPKYKGTKVNKKTLHKYYNDHDGNIYNNTPEDRKTFEIIDGFSEEEVLQAMNNGCTIIYIAGAPLESAEATKVAKAILSKKTITEEVKEAEQLASLEGTTHYGSYYEGLGSSQYDFDANDYVNKKF